ncbi:protein kish-A-like [Hippopotamus amphibius kiboko]|uniref:protein kish-A-like n=1 Tax=Hippopotamus amphibius kiboko TaxID=575201 RepID=UPI002597A04A|nr:protein kish-A-like [Hippopotamus amphibius kiboko]
MGGKPRALWLQRVRVQGRGFAGLTVSAIFSFRSLLTGILLLIGTCVYIRALAPRPLDRSKTGLLAVFWKCGRTGEWKGPDVAVRCVVMAFGILFTQ